MKHPIVFINPNLVIQKGDFLGSGIPFMPFVLAYVLGYLKKMDISAKLIDSFGENPFQLEQHGDFYYQGINIDQIIKKLPRHPKAIFIYASSVTNIDFNLLLIKRLKKELPESKIIVLSNTQAVTSFNIAPLAPTLLSAGVDFIISNNIEESTYKLISTNFSKDNDNLIYALDGKPKSTPMSLEIGNIKTQVTPAWSQFPLHNYWKLGYSHGPKQKKFLALLTSYGCPFGCHFCVNPSINKSRWQSKPANFVYQEMKDLNQELGVSEFHIEDLDPTVDKRRIQELCQLLIDNNLKFNWKLVAGTKVETVDPHTVTMMRKAGCSYMSISPETGSPRLLKLMNKPFNFQHANSIIATTSQVGIKTQACFILGYPGETTADQEMTFKYIQMITKLGIDEIAIFIVTPLPGTQISSKFKKPKDYSQLTFSPKWRKNYKSLSTFRSKLYRSFIFWKLIYHPQKIIFQAVNFLTGNFQTKMEMIPFRMIRFNLLLLVNRFS